MELERHVVTGMGSRRWWDMAQRRGAHCRTVVKGRVSVRVVVHCRDRDAGEVSRSLEQKGSMVVVLLLGIVVAGCCCSSVVEGDRHDSCCLEEGHRCRRSNRALTYCLVCIEVLVFAEDDIS